MSRFPIRRMRRLRRTGALPPLVGETPIAPPHLAWAPFGWHAQGGRRGGECGAPGDMLEAGGAGTRRPRGAAGHPRVPIMSYAAKRASAFYGPFRGAAGSPPQFGDRQSYQMQGTNADEAMKEIALDVDEGADIILVKPALPCLDLIRRARQEFGAPPAAYQVSGEYAMINAAAERGLVGEARGLW